MKAPKVSIITMTYNNEQYIDGAVASILAQDYPHMEVIIRDDGSRQFHPDRIRSLFAGQEDKLEGITIVQGPTNMGTVRNFNEAIKLSTGDIIVPLSCDDCFYDSTVVSDIVRTFQSTGCLLCSANRKGRQSGTVEPNARSVADFQSSSPDRRFARLCYSNFISGATLYYSREIIDRMGGMDERFCLLEDYPFVLKAALECLDIAFMDRIAILYNEGGISQKQKKTAVHPKLQQDFQKVYELLIFPNAHRLPRKLCRYLQFRYRRQYRISGLSQKLLYCLQYPDVFFRMLCWSVQAKLTGKPADKFQSLMNDR